MDRALACDDRDGETELPGENLGQNNTATLNGSSGGGQIRGMGQYGAIEVIRIRSARRCHTRILATGAIPPAPVPPPPFRLEGPFQHSGSPQADVVGSCRFPYIKLSFVCRFPSIEFSFRRFFEIFSKNHTRPAMASELDQLLARAVEALGAFEVGRLPVTILAFSGATWRLSARTARLGCGPDLE